VLSRLVQRGGVRSSAPHVPSDQTSPHYSPMNTNAHLPTEILHFSCVATVLTRALRTGLERLRSDREHNGDRTVITPLVHVHKLACTEITLHFQMMPKHNQHTYKHRKSTDIYINTWRINISYYGGVVDVDTPPSVTSKFRQS
jgi:hypothetical protein